MSDSGRRLDAHLVSPIVAGYDTREVGLADGLFRTGRWGLERDFSPLHRVLESAGGRRIPRSVSSSHPSSCPAPPRSRRIGSTSLQRISAAPEAAARISETGAGIDVTALLPKVSVPTLVMHARDDARVPYELGRRMAAGIPGARFVTLTGRNHLFLETEPAFGQFLQHVRAFLAS